MDDTELVGLPSIEAKEITRRDALRTGAIIGGAVFVIPVVETISMSRAAAQTPSGGNGQGQNNHNQGGNQGANQGGAKQ